MPFWRSIDFFQLAYCTTGIAVTWRYGPWGPLVKGSMTVTFSLCASVSLLWRLCSKPRRLAPAQVAAANPINDVAGRRTANGSPLFALPDVVADVYTFLPRSDADAGQLVSRKLRDAVDANVKKVPLLSVGVVLVSAGPELLINCSFPCENLVKIYQWILAASHYYTRNVK